MIRRWIPFPGLFSGKLFRQRRLYNRRGEELRKISGLDPDSFVLTTIPTCAG